MSYLFRENTEEIQIDPAVLLQYILGLYRLFLVTNMALALRGHNHARLSLPERLSGY